MSRWPKPEPQSALVLLVPEAEKFVGGFRTAHDPAAAAGVPAHITILYPFRTPDVIDGACVKLLAACFREYEPFEFRLTQVGRFPGVIYLLPEPAEPLRELTRAVWRSFPELPPYEGMYPDIVPHLTVASHADERVLEGIASEFTLAAATCLPILSEAAGITLIDNVSGRWTSVGNLPLGRLPLGNEK